MESSAIDLISGGLNGIRLPDTGLPAITAQEYRICVEATGKTRSDAEGRGREIHRRLSVTLASQVLSLLGMYFIVLRLRHSTPSQRRRSLTIIWSSQNLMHPHNVFIFCQTPSYSQILWTRAYRNHNYMDWTWSGIANPGLLHRGL